ncbi:MAG: hypothetical protein ACI9OJ_002097 [Myxococcota bacterium]|jgi:hypothetical protein
MSSIRFRFANFALASLFALTSVAGCAVEADVIDTATDETPGGSKDSTGKEDASNEAVFLEFEFEGVLFTQSTWDYESQIENQLLYTIGQLNGDNSVSRLDKAELTNIRSEAHANGHRVTYNAQLIVAWGKKNNVPENYTFLLPLDTTVPGYERFTESYKGQCVDYGAHDVDSNSMWYYYRPAAYSCDIAEGDIFKAEAKVSLSAINTTGQYPEYHKIWEDNVFRTVAIFGKYKHGATSNGDPGIGAYNGYVTATIERLREHGATTTPAELSTTPGVETPDVTIRATLPGGQEVEVVVLLIDGVQSAGSTFDSRYAEVSADADFIAYNGHSGLGANIRALARKGEWKANQYTIVFMNGCDTYAYVDSALAEPRMELNDDDPNGTRYLDMVMNALPSPSALADENTLAIFDGLLAFETPKTFEQIFLGIGKRQVVLVSGEEDNVYTPGYDPNATEPVGFDGQYYEGSVQKDEEQRFETPVLPAGTYLVELSGDGDADLYLRAGDAPTMELYDCRPYQYGTNEVCKTTLNAPTALHVMVRGWDSESTFELNIAERE